MGATLDSQRRKVLPAEDRRAGESDPNCGRNRDVSYHNWFSEADESQRGDKVLR